MCQDKCPYGEKNCIFNYPNHDEDYCFSPQMRYDVHAKCSSKKIIFQEKYVSSSNKQVYKYMPSFTNEQIDIYLRWHIPSDYRCCDECYCCNGVCFH